MAVTTQSATPQAPSNLSQMAQQANGNGNGKPKGAMTVKDYLESEAYRKQIQDALPKFIDKDRFIRSALSEFRLNKALQECSVPSVMGYFMQAAALGLEPASTLGQCYPVPFNNKNSGAKECQFILGFRGMAAIARRSGEVTSIDAHVVHERDEFLLEYGIDAKLSHKPYLDGDPGTMRGAYAVVRFKDGSYQYAFMPRFEIEKHHKRSKSGTSGPWITDYEEMAKKTVFRSMFKWLPIVVEAQEAESSDETVARYNAKSGEIEHETVEDVEYTVSTPENETPTPEVA